MGHPSLPLLLLLLQASLFTETEMMEGAPPASQFIRALMEDYETNVTPTFDKGTPTVVNVSLHINSIDSVNEQSMDFSLNIFVTQTWVDKRLEFGGLIDAEYLELDSKLTSQFWVPDLYFVNEKSSDFHMVTVPNRLLHLYNTGKIVYKLRISLRATCYMLLHKYPLDDQTCTLYMKSFGYSNKSLQFQWDQRPLSRQGNLEMSQFTLRDLREHRCDSTTAENISVSRQYNMPHNATFTCLAVDLDLRRNIGFYMIQLYVPSILVVVLSWVSFCLDVEAVPARISLGILTVLTMTNMKTHAESSLPKVSYIKALDIWMATCLMFVFSTLLEFAVVNAFARRLPSRDKTHAIVAEFEAEIPLQSKPSNGIPPRREEDKKVRLESARNIDKMCLILFPVFFLLFVLGYAIVYM